MKRIYGDEYGHRLLRSYAVFVQGAIPATASRVAPVGGAAARDIIFPHLGRSPPALGRGGVFSTTYRRQQPRIDAACVLEGVCVCVCGR